MRALIIIALLAIAGVIGWMVLGGQGAVTETSAPTAEDAPAAAETETVEEKAEDATDEASEAVETLEDKANDAAQQVEEKADEVMKEAEEKAEEVMEDAKEKADEVMQGAAEKVNEAVEGALESVNGATDEATNNDVESAVTKALDTEVAPSETTGSLADALTVDGFDAAALRQALAESDLGFAKSQLAEGLIAQAEENPEIIQSVVDQLKDLLPPN